MANTCYWGDFMDKRLTFNEDAKNYDMFRPTYCKELFDNIINYTRLDKTKHAVEIGIGTGQATKPILETGCYLTAIELGENLAAYSKNKFSDYKKITIHNISFEEYMYTPESIDLVYSGTAFHWIAEEVGYKKAYDMLRSGGTIALFWNRPSGGESEVYYEEIQSVYRKYMSDAKLREYTPDQHIYDERMETIKKYGFVDIQFKLMHQTRKFNAEDYISLLETYSDHRVLSEAIKVPFYKEIMSIINNYGGAKMVQSIIHIALVVKDYDEAIDFYTKKLNFILIEDTYQPEQDKRWVVVSPPNSVGTTILLAKASKPEQESFIGNQSGGRVFIFLNTDDFWRDYNEMISKSIEFVREPKEQSYGIVAVFKDLYGNLWDLVELKEGHPILKRIKSQVK